MTQEEQLHNRVLGQLDMTEEIDDEMLSELIRRILKEEARHQYIPLTEQIQIGKELFNAFRKLDILQELIEDHSITEIMINGTESIFVERGGCMTLLDKRFRSRAKLEDIIQQIVSGSNRIVNESSPIVDARLEDGSRVNIVLYPIALNGPIVTIRKFSQEAITMDQMIASGTLNRETAEFLKQLVAAKYNIFISGGTSAGKTTFLNALSQYIPSDERIITIEDNAELSIQNIPNLVRLEVRNANAEGAGGISMRDLIRSALRMRPTRIIIGEVRGGEALDLLQALNTGHSGSLSTGHSNSAKDMLSRLETMTLMGMDLPLEAIQRQIASALDIIVHLGRLQDGQRRVMEITEVLGYEKRQIQTRILYQYQEGKGGLIRLAEMEQKEKLLAAGY